MPATLSQLTDEELACAAQADSLPAFEELVTRHEARLYRFLHARTGSAADARDLTQTAFVTAYRAIRRFNPRYRFAPWLLTIARHALIDHLRARPPATDPLTDSDCDLRDPSVIVAEQEDARAIWDLARRILSNDQFTALWLRHEEDLPVNDVARAMRKTTIHVKVLLHRARQRLQHQLSAARPSATPAGLPEVTP